jgi:diguanylate cyclase (GGDEF)-like protein
VNIGKAMNIVAFLEKQKTAFWILVGFPFVLAVDALTGIKLSFSLFYLLPIATVTWFAGMNWGLAFSALSAVTWFVVDIISGQTYPLPTMRYWNAFIRLGFFVTVALLLPALKALEREKELARTDPLTGAANRRYLFEVLDRELWRSQRYGRPFTVVYIDLDGFKAINDRFGHRTGDEILRTVVRRAKKHLRKTDIIARIGGDEFVLLLPETDRPGSKKTTNKIWTALRNGMDKSHWPLTFSIGALTCRGEQTSSEGLIQKADELMYTVKKSGRNSIAFGEFSRRRDDKVRVARPARRAEGK